MQGTVWRRKITSANYFFNFWISSWFDMKLILHWFLCELICSEKKEKLAGLWFSVKNLHRIMIWWHQGICNADRWPVLTAGAEQGDLFAQRIPLGSLALLLQHWARTWVVCISCHHKESFPVDAAGQHEVSSFWCLSSGRSDGHWNLSGFKEESFASL